MFKHPIEILLDTNITSITNITSSSNIDSSSVAVYDFYSNQLQNIFNYMETVWEHTISHYMYASGKIVQILHYYSNIKYILK